MAADINHPLRLKRTRRHPLWLAILACTRSCSVILLPFPSSITSSALFTLSLLDPNNNPLGQIWYTFILNGDNSYQKVDHDILAGAVEHAFLLGSLYIATSIGLWLRVYPKTFTLAKIN